MTDLFKLILGILASRFKARATLEAENLVLRQQVNVLRRRTPKRPHLNNTDRFLFVWLCRWFPSVLEVVGIVRPETIIRWHRAGFRTYWRWRSRNRVGRPKVSAELRTLIGEMSRANTLFSPVSLPLAWALKSARSFPAVKLSPSPWNRTTRTAGSFPARSSPSDIALYMALLSAFFLSARASFNVMMPASIPVFTCSVMIVRLLTGFVRSPNIRCHHFSSSRGLTA